MGLGLHPYFANRAQAVVTANLPGHWRWDDELMPIAQQKNPLAGALASGSEVTGLPVAAEFTGWTVAP